MRISSILVDCLWLACFAGALFTDTATLGGIITGGNVLPPYPGGDPWNVGGPLCIAYNAEGSMTVNGGSEVINTYGSLGLLTGATGTVTITGSESIWESIGDLSVGRPVGGVGTLTTSEGGTIYVGDAARNGGVVDYLIVSDSDSSGLAGGHLYVYNGSTLTHGSHVTLGDNPSECGWATVDGNGS
ncbi:MAG: hypothetical protein JW829_21090, partial [Pirellulales bacterium]|nr:hypothetical protein [Pirellulales bacterium]